MTVSPPPPPGSTPPSRHPLGFDELIAVVVAFLAIGAILFWSWGRRGQQFAVFDLPTTSPSDAIAPLPGADPLEELRGALSEDDEAESSLQPAPVPTAAPPARSTVVAPVPVPQDPVAPQPRAIAPATTTTVSPLPEPTPSPETVQFPDVPPDYWAFPFIAELARQGIVSGSIDGSFRPEQPITRAEFAALLNQAFEQSPEQREARPFNDVSTDFWAYSAINQAYSTGFLEGYPGNVFQPAQPIPKVQALIALARGIGINDVANPAEVLQTYQDASQIPNYATDRVAAATQAGLVVNEPNSQVLEPNQPATRAEIAAYVYQSLVQQGRAEPINSPYIVRP